MPLPPNKFKSHIKSSNTQIGLWMGIGDAATAEICADTGFEWLVIDAEHGPNTLHDVLDQLRAVGDASHAVVRVRSDERPVIKQMLDLGARNLLVPMIYSATQAREVVQSVFYPPLGVRGVGAALVRASKYGAINDYLHTANNDICLLLQVETYSGIKNLDEILSVNNIDGIFIGPSDLAADMGYPGNPEAPEVQAVIMDALKRIHAANCAAGILTSNIELAQKYREIGVSFLAVGADVSVFRQALLKLRSRF